MGCEFESCVASAVRSGYCDRHYRQLRRKGLVGWGGAQCSQEGCTVPAVTKGLCDKHYQKSRVAQAGPCSVDECDRPVFAKGWCQVHYMRFKRHGDPLAYKKVREECTQEGCNKKQAAHGLCDTHYRRFQKYGVPELPERPVHVEPPLFRCIQCDAELPKQERGRAYYCSDICRADHQYWRRRTQARRNHLSRQYGITVEEYDARLLAQDGCCAICKGEEPQARRGENWSVDHDHATGVVRGLLCGSCNVGLGNFKDSVANLLAAAEYLIAFEKQAVEDAP